MFSMIKIIIPNKEYHHKQFLLENPNFPNAIIINEFHIL